MGEPSFATGVSFYNITSPNHFAPVGPSDKSSLGVNGIAHYSSSLFIDLCGLTYRFSINPAFQQVHAFADKGCAHTVLILVNTDATEKLMDGAENSPLWYLHRSLWVLTTSGSEVHLNGRPVTAGGGTYTRNPPLRGMSKAF